MDQPTDTEDAWIFDSLVGFLRGPVWHVPVMSFLEQKSLSKYISCNFNLEIQIIILEHSSSF